MQYIYVTDLYKMPINCPVCNGPLINNFKEYPKGNTYAMDKTCFTPSHKFYCASSIGDENKLSFISISLDPYKKVSVNWLILEKKMYINGKESLDNIKESSVNNTYIPYIEPDFSNPVKLLNKIRLYCKLL